MSTPSGVSKVESTYLVTDAQVSSVEFNLKLVKTGTIEGTSSYKWTYNDSTIATTTTETLNKTLQQMFGISSAPTSTTSYTIKCEISNSEYAGTIEKNCNLYIGPAA